MVKIDLLSNLKVRISSRASRKGSDIIIINSEASYRHFKIVNFVNIKMDIIIICLVIIN